MQATGEKICSGCGKGGVVLAENFVTPPRHAKRASGTPVIE